MDRRTTRRHFLFRPHPQRRIEQAFWYCLAYAAHKYDIEVHAAVLMSTHPHYEITDTAGNRPRFKQEFHRLFALCVKAIHGWPERDNCQELWIGGRHDQATYSSASSC